MARKSQGRQPLIVRCERCGQEASVERAGWFSDEDYAELLQEYMALDLENRELSAQLQHARMKLEWANERIEQMAALINDGIEPAETVGEDYNPFA